MDGWFPRTTRTIYSTNSFQEGRTAQAGVCDGEFSPSVTPLPDSRLGSRVDETGSTGPQGPSEPAGSWLLNLHIVEGRGLSGSRVGDGAYVTIIARGAATEWIP